MERASESVRIDNRADNIRNLAELQDSPSNNSTRIDHS